MKHLIAIAVGSILGAAALPYAHADGDQTAAAPSQSCRLASEVATARPSTPTITSTARYQVPTWLTPPSTLAAAASSD